MTVGSVLQAIEGDVRHLPSEQFRRREDVPLETAPRIRRIALDREVKLAPIDVVVDEAMRRFANHPPKSDAWLGPRLHAALRLTSREATDHGMWAWLHVLALPNYVRWR